MHVLLALAMVMHARLQSELQVWDPLVQSRPRVVHFLSSSPETKGKKEKYKYW